MIFVVVKDIRANGRMNEWIAVRVAKISKFFVSNNSDTLYFDNLEEIIVNLKNKLLDRIYHHGIFDSINFGGDCRPSRTRYSGLGILHAASK